MISHASFIIITVISHALFIITTVLPRALFIVLIIPHASTIIFITTALIPHASLIIVSVIQYASFNNRIPPTSFIITMVIPVCARVCVCV